VLAVLCLVSCFCPLFLSSQLKVSGIDFSSDYCPIKKNISWKVGERGKRPEKTIEKGEKKRDRDRDRDTDTDTDTDTGGAVTMTLDTRSREADTQTH
jgi:hypothetical protein